MIRLKKNEDAPRYHQDEAGQVLALGALSMLVLALMLMMSFSINTAIHEKIRIQQHADSQAYSLAVVEARAFNYFAYANRAMAAGYVAMTTLHAYMAAMAVIPDMYTAAAITWLMAAGIEFAMMCTCQPYCCAVQHLPPALKSLKSAWDSYDEADDAADDVSEVDEIFVDTVKALDLTLDAIYLSELFVLGYTTWVLWAGEDLDSLRMTNAPQASRNPDALGLINALRLACSIEAPTDILTDFLGVVSSFLPISIARCPSSSSKEARQKVMTEVANATRPGWTTARKSDLLPIAIFPLYIHFNVMDTLMSDLPPYNDGISIPLPFTHLGTAKMTSSSDDGELEDHDQGHTGQAVGGDEHGVLFSYVGNGHEGVGIMPYSAYVMSDADGGDHDGMLSDGGHGDDDHEFDGVQAAKSIGCLIMKNCFIKFRSNDDEKNDYGQPSTYAYTDQDLNYLPGGRAGGPWELNSSGSMTLGHGAQGSGTLKMRPEKKGAAVAKAKVYYHRFGDWSEPPNFFNPYWRAKLHPFKPDEVMTVIPLANSEWAEWGVTIGLMDWLLDMVS